MLIDQFFLLHCAPNIAPITIGAIIKSETNANPWAIQLNKGKKLKYPARSYKQAVAWANYLELNHYDFDIGIAQVNIKNAHRYGYKAYQLLDSCTNLKIASDILQKNYLHALKLSTTHQEALKKAISAYNTGSYSAGFDNGYVYRVINNAKLILH